jgi:hypothetical protein
MERARAWASVVFPEPGRPVTTMSVGVFIMLVRSLTASVGHDQRERMTYNSGGRQGQLLNHPGGVRRHRLVAVAASRLVRQAVPALVQHDNVVQVLKRRCRARPVASVIGQAVQEQQGRFIVLAS